MMTTTTTATTECSSLGAYQKYCTIDFEETELRLGLAPPPLVLGTQATASVSTKNAADSESTVKINTGKRGFSDTVDLKLNLSSSSTLKDDDHTSSTLNTTKPPAKTQVVGWPPVRSFRKNIMSVQKGGGKEGEISGGGAAFVKVSLDGAPYLRKVDLKLYKSYTELSDALTKMFSSFTIIGNCGSQGMKDFMNESKLIDLLNGSDYVPTYEDKDGDWMLVGDVPWEMFVNSCKRLRIMKGSEAIGLAPRAIEKCKNRS